MRYHLVLIGASIILATACNNSADTASGSDSTLSKDKNLSTTDTTAAIAVDSSAGMSTQSIDEPGKKFIASATSGGWLEVKLGTMAQAQGSNARVKEFGAMMVKDHTEATTKLKTIANSLQVAVSDSLMKEHQHHVMELGKKKGGAFDKAYMSMMVNDHKKDIMEFEKASRDPNKALSEFAIQTLPVLQKHLDSAQSIYKKM